MTKKEIKEARYELTSDRSILTTPEGQKWTLVSLLEGRGQPGLAGFYRNPTGDVFLVKADNPGTCLAEATSTNVFVPHEYQKSVNCAQIGFLDKDLITIQPLVSAADNQKVIGLDKVVYGRKRKPKTLVSEEFMNESKIKQKLGGFTADAKRDLASALFASTALGDESLHLGQFMAVVSDSGFVTGVVRVDFGARERFTRERANSGDFSPVQTSRAYSRSGQWGKNYISYLVNSDVKIRVLYLTLWSKANVREIANALVEKFKEELNSLPKDKQSAALGEFLEQFNKSSKSPLVLDEKLDFEDQKEQFFSEYRVLVGIRCSSMAHNSQSCMLKMIKEHALSEYEQTTLMTFFTKQSLTQDLIEDVHEIHEKLIHESSDELAEAIQARMEWYYVDNNMSISNQNTTNKIMSTLAPESVGQTSSESDMSESDMSDDSEDENDSSVRCIKRIDSTASGSSEKTSTSFQTFEISDLEEDEEDEDESKKTTRSPGR